MLVSAGGVGCPIDNSAWSMGEEKEESLLCWLIVDVFLDAALRAGHARKEGVTELAFKFTGGMSDDEAVQLGSAISLIPPPCGA
jgi:hypothetical protein